MLTEIQSKLQVCAFVSSAEKQLFENGFYCHSSKCYIGSLFFCFATTLRGLFNFEVVQKTPDLRFWWISFWIKGPMNLMIVHLGLLQVRFRRVAAF